MNVLATLEEDRQPVVTIEDSSLGSDLERAWLTGSQGGLYCLGRETPKLRDLYRTEDISGMQEW